MHSGSWGWYGAQPMCGSRRTTGVCSLFTFCRFPGSNSGLQTCTAVPLPTEPSTSPELQFFPFLSFWDQVSVYSSGYLDLPVQTKLASNSQQSACLYFLSAGTKDICHHTWHLFCPPPSFSLFLITCMCACTCDCVCTRVRECRFSRRPEVWDVRAPGTGVTGLGASWHGV